MATIRWRHLLVAAVVLLAAAAPLRADPPGRVARLNYISGQVSFRPASLDDWGAATINYPLTTGDHLWTDRNAHAEVHVGGSVFRLAPETAFAFLNLDDDVMQARVAEGSVDLRVREVFGNEVYEVDTPNAAISLVRSGIYRIDVDPDGTRTRIVVRAGQVDVHGNGRSFSLYGGDMVEIKGTDDFSYDIGRAPSPDAWEQWCRERDRREDTRVSLRYVSRNMVGYEDLDDHGSWDYVPEYGWAWQPTVVAVDWAPYRYGHWGWVGPWGWTWIDDARWGFAPFHYGRWAFHRSRWLWVPGSFVRRPVYAPALVAFVGGHNWSLSFAFGSRASVGWFPLAPGELYCPSYRHTPAHFRNVNITNVHVSNINIANVDVTNMRYANRGVAGAMTAVPRDEFVGAQSVRRTGLAVPRMAAAQAAVIGHAANEAPEARSVMGRVPSSVARPPASAMRRTVVARSEPPAAATHGSPVVVVGAPNRERTATRPGLASPGDRPGDRVETPSRPAQGRVRNAEPSTPSVAGRPTTQDQPERATPWRPSAPSGADRPTPQTQPERATPWRPSAPSVAPPARTNDAPRPLPRDSGDAGAWRPSGRSAELPRRMETERPATSGRPFEPARPQPERAMPRHESAAPSAPERPSVVAPRRSEERAPERPAASAPARAERPSGGGPATSAKPPERAQERPQPSRPGTGRGRGGDRSKG